MTHVEQKLNSPFKPARSRLEKAAAAAQQVAEALVLRAPGATDATRAGARDLVHTLQALPDTTLRRLAGLSAALGAGFYLAGAPRLLVAAGLTPAFVMCIAIIGRPPTPAVTT